MASPYPLRDVCSVFVHTLARMLLMLRCYGNNGIGHQLRSVQKLQLYQVHNFGARLSLCLCDQLDMEPPICASVSLIDTH